MRGLPAAARGYIGCAAPAAALCAAPAMGLGPDAPWSSALALALLYGLCEQLRRCRPPVGRAPYAPDSGAPGGFPTGWAGPVLLAGVFLLPPPLAALAAVPGALLAPAGPRFAAARRLWHAAELALACWAAAQVFRVLGHQPLSAPQFPVVLLPAAAAAATFCVVLAALDGGVLAAAERHPVRTAWRGLLTRSLGPHLVHGLAGLMMAVLWCSSYGPPAALLVLLPMYLSCWAFDRYHRERAAHQATIRALVQAVDIKDRYTRGHSERVGRASVMIARELGLAEDRMEALRFAGILHDVGKLGVPTRLLRKDGPLTPQERRVIELHPEYGHEIVRGIGFLEEARAAILHHHERLDGSGYPYGLRGHQIPEVARVVAVADAFDAMTSTRSYRRARPVPAAVAELRKCAGAQFDPRMVRALVASLDRDGWHPDLVTAADPEPGAGRSGQDDALPRDAAGGTPVPVPPVPLPERAGRDGAR
ncbi:HD-GYP domain-containing protein [Streptomyces platensis]|uniref:HD-GYP domain-containing protein n=1 Tax=Streptomyces platensis TaxID=58346 RepID=UPI002E0DF020|nr:HD-GYP domain-containing protein [Streptomyces platensis]WUB79925.1 HD-GYP domain-containing protein [Streptomyces platensis]